MALRLAWQVFFVGWLMQLYIAIGLVTCNSFAIPSSFCVGMTVILWGLSFVF